jgi:hypothetical protein
MYLGLVVSSCLLVISSFFFSCVSWDDGLVMNFCNMVSQLEIFRQNHWCRVAAVAIKDHHCRVATTGSRVVAVVLELSCNNIRSCCIN